MENSFDPRPLLRALPSTECSEPARVQGAARLAQSQSSFYQEDNIAHVEVQPQAGILQSMLSMLPQFSDQALVDPVLLIQRWVNADPATHTRLALFEVLLTVNEVRRAREF